MPDRPAEEIPDENTPGETIPKEDQPAENSPESRPAKAAPETPPEPEEQGILLLSVNDYYDLLMEQQEQM